jgi:hypothetical protein
MLAKRNYASPHLRPSFAAVAVLPQAVLTGPTLREKLIKIGVHAPFPADHLPDGGDGSAAGVVPRHPEVN